MIRILIACSITLFTASAVSAEEPNTGNNSFKNDALGSAFARLGANAAKELKKAAQKKIPEAPTDSQIKDAIREKLIQEQQRSTLLDGKALPNLQKNLEDYYKRHPEKARQDKSTNTTLGIDAPDFGDLK